MNRLYRIWHLVLLLTLILTACAPAAEPATVIATSTQPATSTPETTPADSSLLEAGLRYSDTSGDMAAGFLDVVVFQAAVNEELELLEIVLQMRDIPSEATRRQMRNVAEYMWRIAVFLNPTVAQTADDQADYYLIAWTVVTDPPTPGQEILTPMPGEPETVPISQLWDDKFINNQQGDYIPGLQAVMDPNLDTITLKARIPGITSSTVFSFSTSYYDGSQDLPDNVISSGVSNLPTPQSLAIQPPAVQPSGDTSQFIPAGNVRAYPGPAHYTGDVLTFEIMTDGNFDETIEVTLQLGDDEPFVAKGNWNSFNAFLLPSALDTTGLSGRHTLTLKTLDGQLNEMYQFEVLPAEERPAQEENASWQVKETDCCSLHYVSNTAAARDIEYIAERFQQAAVEFVEITGEHIDPKLKVYIMDRMWGNGGFGGNGELVISYTDRYYGPTIGAEGLETLARHEFTHAAGVGPQPGGYGVEFNSEGVAVFVAGGHYKPEPLAQRGAALYDLGYYIPVSQFLNQHELAYLYPAAMLAYIVETYGMEGMWKFLAPDVKVGPEEFIPLEDALRFAFGKSLQEFDSDFRAWLEAQDPGEQLDDLRLTIRLQDLRRQYQDTYAPPPFFLLASAADVVARPEYLPVIIREARAPENIVIELLIANGQQAIVDGDYVEAERLIATLEDILTTGNFGNSLANEYYSIVLALADADYEAQTLDLQGTMATVQVTEGDTTLLNLELQKSDGVWHNVP